MIEDIKKEIRQIPLYAKSTPRPTIDYLDVMEILDKYKDIDDLHKDVICLQNSEKKDLLKYKNAWEELKNKFNKYTTTISDTMEELEQKHNISKEME